MRSIRIRYTLIVVGLIAATVVGSILLNLAYFEIYYFKNKEKSISQMYELIDSMLKDVPSSDFTWDGYAGLDSESELSLRQYCENSNLDLMVLEGNRVVVGGLTGSIMNHCVFSRGNERELKNLIFGYALGSRYNADNVIIRDENHYVCQAHDEDLETDFLESFGTTKDKRFFIVMRTPLQNMQENIMLSNEFNLRTAIAILMLGAVIAYLFAGRMSRPIKKLSEIAGRMERLDFTARYDGKEKDEIGVLGNTMNQLSHQLERTITELKEANLELRRDIEKKDARETMRQEFLAGVSHELKTPIALIQGYAEGLRDGVTEDEESKNWYCDVIIDEAAKMNRMVRQMLTLNEIEFGSAKGRMEHFDLGEMIRGVLASYQIMFLQKDVTLKLICAESVYVWADELRIEDVLRNYLNNALNHVDGERVITVETQEREDLIRVNVKNTGRPIPEEEQEKIWLRFYKVDKARTREYGGNGIGLSIVKAVMEAHGRDCGVYNAEDGVVFWFELDK